MAHFFLAFFSSSLGVGSSNHHHLTPPHDHSTTAPPFCEMRNRPAIEQTKKTWYTVSLRLGSCSFLLTKNTFDLSCCARNVRIYKRKNKGLHRNVVNLSGMWDRQHARRRHEGKKKKSRTHKRGGGRLVRSESLSSCHKHWLSSKNNKTANKRKQRRERQGHVKRNERQMERQPRKMGSA